MEQLLKGLKLDFAFIRLAYSVGREQGRKAVRGMLIFPGIRIADLEKIAAKNGDQLKELIAKRDAMLDATIDFIEEVVNIDDD